MALLYGSAAARKPVSTNLYNLTLGNDDLCSISTAEYVKLQPLLYKNLHENLKF
jgi:hypothetical protein